MCTVRERTCYMFAVAQLAIATPKAATCVNIGACVTACGNVVTVNIAM